MLNTGAALTGDLQLGQVTNGQLNFTDLGNIAADEGVGSTLSDLEFIATGDYLGTRNTAATSDFLLRNTATQSLAVGADLLAGRRHCR